MVELATLILSPGPKGFFENAAYLLGIPLVALGILGLMLVLSPIELRWPQPASTEGEATAEGHPSARVYIQVGIVLAIITAVEVALYYIPNMADGVLLAFLLILSAMKFVLVVLWFMHLMFDSRLFSVLFSGALALVVTLFIVVLTSLGASLV
jgi:cytochrome c oxidase subunit 4